MCLHATQALPPEPASARAARVFLRDRFEEWGLLSILDEAQLAVTELVTNAVLHARTPLTVSVSCTGGFVELAVFDGSPVLPATRKPGDVRGDAVDFIRPHVQDSGEAARGRGLLLVDALAAEWGVSPQSDGKAVWIRTPVPEGWSRPGGCTCADAVTGGPNAVVQLASGDSVAVLG